MDFLRNDCKHGKGLTTLVQWCINNEQKSSQTYNLTTLLEINNSQNILT